MFKYSISIHDIRSEKNLVNIEETISLDISVKLEVIENVHISAFFS